jgi:hypothetical protein
MQVRFGDENGISSVKTLYCQADQLAALLMIETEDAELALSCVAHVLSTSGIDDTEEIEVEKLLGRPLAVLGMKLHVSHPLLRWSGESMRRFKPNYYVLNKISREQ